MTLYDDSSVRSVIDGLETQLSNETTKRDKQECIQSEFIKNFSMSTANLTSKMQSSSGQLLFDYFITQLSDDSKRSQGIDNLIKRCSSAI